MCMDAVSKDEPGQTHVVKYSNRTVNIVIQPNIGVVCQILFYCDCFHAHVRHSDHACLAHYLKII